MVADCSVRSRDTAHDTRPVVTGNAPLVWEEMIWGAMRAFCGRNRPVFGSRFVLSGANPPASVAQVKAKALAYTPGIRRHSLSTASIRFGTPEISPMKVMIGQSVRDDRVPRRTSNALGGARTFDAEAGPNTRRWPRRSTRAPTLSETPPSFARGHLSRDDRPPAARRAWG